MIITAIRTNGEKDEFKVSGGQVRAWKQGLKDAGFVETVYTNGATCLTALGRDEYHYDDSEWDVCWSLEDGQAYVVVFANRKPVSAALIFKHDPETITKDEARKLPLKKVQDLWGEDEGYWPLFNYFRRRTLN